MIRVTVSIDERQHERLLSLARQGERTLAAEARRAFRAWTENGGAPGGGDNGGVSAVDPQPPSPPPILPPRPIAKPARTTPCEHRRPPSSFCKYCDI